MSIRFQMTDNNTFLAISADDLITQQQKQLIMFVKFHVFYSVSCFLRELPLILRVGRKLKGRAGDNYKSTLNIEFEQDLSFTLGGTLGDGQKIKKYIFLFTTIFSGKADSAIFLGFECTMNPQNLMKIVGAIFQKMKILNFFLCELPITLKYP